MFAHIMRRSIFGKYFLICASMILVSIVFLGIMLMLFTSKQFQKDRYQLLATSAQTALSYASRDLTKGEKKITVNAVVKQYLDTVADAVGITIFLADSQGDIFLRSNPRENVVTATSGVRIPKEILQKITTNGIYQEVGTLENVYEQNSYTVALPFETSYATPPTGMTGTDPLDIVLNGEIPLRDNDSLLANDQTFHGYLFCSSEATASFEEYFIQNLRTFVLSALLVLVIVFMLIYAVTYQMVQPLKEMSRAAQSFGQGDFSTRLSIRSKDEVGQLGVALNEMAQSLSVLEMMQRSFVSNVSHELKTPMQTIGGFVDGVLDGTIPPENQKKYLRIVSGEIRRLSTIVRSMLDLARIEAGQTELNLQPVNAVETICKTLFTLERQIEQKNLTVLGLEQTKQVVEVDEQLLRQVIYNLTENAIKFSNTDGYIAFHLRTEGEFLWISIKNSGEGLAEEELSQVFNRFYKTDQSRGQDKSGVGLGLYIVRSIVALHGGSIVARSVKGEYCEFEFSVPMIKSVE